MLHELKLQYVYSNKALIIDIPVKVDALKIVRSIASLSLQDDFPATIFHMS